MICIAVVALVQDGHVLLVHRRPDRENYPDCWAFPEAISRTANRL